MRSRTDATVQAAEQAALAEGTTDSQVILWHLEKRREALRESPAALCFGRIDEEHGDRHYIGRRHIEDANGEAVVVDWRAHAAAPFYRATFADPMGLDVRRRFIVDGRVLVDMFEEDFSDPDSAGRGGVPDPLLAELDRSRSGRMRDIVATIQAEQDEVIRAPLDEVVIVQGGPGSGKTAVGLHRAAFLLYEYRDYLERRNVLIVGPNPVFLRYIAQVLPSLGETAVVQSTVEGLVGARYRIRADDDASVAIVKGDARMSEVVRRVAIDMIQPPLEDVTLSTPYGTLTLDAAVVDEEVWSIVGRGRPLNEGRAALRRTMIDLAWNRYRDRPLRSTVDESSFKEAMRSSVSFRRLIDAIWPSISAAAIVRRLYASAARLEELAGDLLDDHERSLLARSPAKKVSDERWTAADVPLLDEADAIAAGVGASYGHVIIDEAQDLSAMALRMVARRSPDRSMTVLGDLAQATTPASQTSWDSVAQHLNAPDVHLVELDLGYRVPAALLDYANRLLPSIAPGLRPARSVRMTGRAPRILKAVGDADVGHIAVVEACALASEWTTVALVVPDSAIDSIITELRERDVAFADSQRGELGDGISVVPAGVAKGLEFDAVVVVEPGRIAAEYPNGLRLLYVSLTRAVQELTLVHAEPLPDAIQSAPSPA
jgi:DNA helicase IV